MQVIRLVNPGVVDKAIAFDSLPERMLKTIRRGGVDGFPRHWKTFLGVKADDKEPHPFYILEYKFLNQDKEKWQEICNYVRSAAGKEVRLLDNMEDMAVPFAPDSYQQMTLEPEDIPVIPLPTEGAGVVSAPPKDRIQVSSQEPEQKKRGRPKKEPVLA